MSNKSVEIEILLRETIVEGIKKAKEAFKDLNSEVKGNTTNFKEEIQQQKLAVKGLIDEIAKLKKELEKIPSPAESPMGSVQKNVGIASGLSAQIKAREKELITENKLLDDLQQKKVEGNKKEEASQGGLISSLGKWAIGLATVTGAMKIGKAIIESTEGSAHAYEQVVTSATSAVNFFFQSIASGDWSNFSAGLDIATKGAIEYVNAMEEVNRLANQEKVINSDLEQQKQDALTNTWDRSKENRPKRMKGLQDVIDITKNQNINTRDVLQKKYDAEIKKLSTDTGDKIKPDEAIALIGKWTVINEKTGQSIKDVKELGDEYNRLSAIKFVAPYSTPHGGSAGNADEYEKAQKRIAELGPHAAEAGKEAAKYNLVTFQAMDKIADIYKNLGEAKGQVKRGPIFQERQLAQAINENNKDDEAAAKKAKEDAELDNRIKAQEELVKKLAETSKIGDTAELDRQTQKLVLLQKEKELREWLIKGAQAMAENKPLDNAGAQTATGALLAVAGAMDIKTTSETDAAIKKMMDKQKKDNEEIIKAYEKSKKKGIQLDDKDAKATADAFYMVANASAELSKNLASSNAELAGVLSGVSSLANQFGKLFENNFKMTRSQGIGMAISGATQLIGILANSAAERKRVMDEYYANIINQQQQYNLLLNEQLRLNSDISGTLFIKNYEGRLEDSTKAFNNAQKLYQDELKKFATAEAITGKKNVVSGQNVLGGFGAGAALGAGIGAIAGGGVLSLPAAAAGAIIGGIAGALTGLFATKKKDIVAPLLETFPKLIKETGEFDAALAKTLIANKQVTEATAKTLQNLIDWKEAAEKAAAQLNQVITDLAGSMGDDLRNALVTAFKDGTDASKAFGDSVNKTLENILSNMIFNKVFEGAFKKLQDGMNASYGIGPDGKPITGAVVDYSWVDDFKTFMDQKGALTEQFNQALTDWGKVGSDSGFDIFGKSTGSSAKGMTADIKAITEETGTVLVGSINAIRLNIARLIENGTTGTTMLQKSLEYQQRTADNTETMDKTLTNIDNRLARLELDGIKVK